MAMAGRVDLALTVTAALGSGLVAGVLLAFSSFVMAALARLPPPQGIAAMQAINVTVINPLFMGIFLGTGVLCVALVAAHVGRRSELDSVLIFAAGLAYLAGCLGVTMACNVPLNDALAAVDASSAEAAASWSRYLRHWTAWNHARTLAAALAAIMLIAAARAMPAAPA